MMDLIDSYFDQKNKIQGDGYAFEGSLPILDWETMYDLIIWFKNWRETEDVKKSYVI